MEPNLDYVKGECDMMLAKSHCLRCEERTDELLCGMQQLHKRKAHFVLNEQPIESIGLYMHTSMHGSVITNLVDVISWIQNRQCKG